MGRKVGCGGGELPSSFSFLPNFLPSSSSPFPPPRSPSVTGQGGLLILFSLFKFMDVFQAEEEGGKRKGEKEGGKERRKSGRGVRRK